MALLVVCASFQAECLSTSAPSSGANLAFHSPSIWPVGLFLPAKLSVSRIFWSTPQNSRKILSNLPLPSHSFRLVAKLWRPSFIPKMAVTVSLFLHLLLFDQLLFHFVRACPWWLFLQRTFCCGHPFSCSRT